MFKSVEDFSDLTVDIPVSWCKLIPKAMKKSKIHLVGPVGIRGVDFRLDVGGIIEQKIEYIVAFMLIGPNELRINGDMIGIESRYWYSRREILVGKGFLNVNCTTFDDWAIIFKVPVTTI